MKLINFWKTFSILAMTFVFTIVLTTTPAFAADKDFNRSYHVTVQTGCRGGAGTDSNVTINLRNGDNSTGFRTLDTPAYNDFENCDRKMYTLVNQPNIGIPTSITLKSDNSGIGADWKVDYVVLEEGNASEEMSCGINEWLDKDHKERTVKCTKQ